MLSSKNIRERFLAFFSECGHERVASSPLVPGNDPTLMFTNAGMVQFKDVFLGFDKRSYQRAVTSQRCVRAGGKHNDLENVGYTSRHHTFFEMLGNFSFGDYFKKEAIRLAWQLLTTPQAEGGYGLKREHLWVTVFGGGKLFGEDCEAVQADDEACKHWLEVLIDAGFSKEEAARRITHVPTTDNFWMMGDTGPCGPCSEIFYNRDAAAKVFEGEDEDKADSCVEIWNLVFMQYNRGTDGVLVPLPAPCVDTGMGLERLSAIIQGVESNYDTDLFAALLESTAIAVDAAGGKAKQDSASLRVIADHIRAASYMVADKVLPSNEGRGYVLRRIIRRALRHGHQLGASKPFFASLVPVLAELMGEAHPELIADQDRVTKVLLREEERFAQTLGDGMRILGKMASGSSKIDGETVFKLYDTYGFPADLTVSFARDNGMEADLEGFERELAKQRERSRSASGFKANLQSVFYDGPATRFERDPEVPVSGEIVALYNGSGEAVTELVDGSTGLAVLSETSFYGEAGGQIGDSGVLSGSNGEARVITTARLRQDVFGHEISVTAGGLRVGETLDCEINRNARQAACRAHSATHLLHEALRRRFSQAEQRGSHVEGDRLRFDFNHDSHLSEGELREIEAEVNAQVLADAQVIIEELPYDEAIKRGAKALFGEKYGEVVRMVQIDPDYSIELCGGTHASHASQIGLFHIESENAIAAGIRRIEAQTGFSAQHASHYFASVASRLARLLKSSPEQLHDRVLRLSEDHAALQARCADLEEDLLQSAAGDWAQAIGSLDGNANGVQLSLSLPQGGASVSVARVEGKVALAQVECADLKANALKTLGHSLCERMQPSAVVLLGLSSTGCILVASVSNALSRQLSAKELAAACIGELPQVRGGGGPEQAQGGGNATADEVKKALSAAIALSKEKLGG